MSVFYKHPLSLPLGEVDEQSEDGEGKLGRNALSVTCGDSSPGGRAKGVRMLTQNCTHKNGHEEKEESKKQDKSGF